MAAGNLTNERETRLNPYEKGSWRHLRKQLFKFCNIDITPSGFVV